MDTTLLCEICNALLVQKAGAVRKACAGDCSRARRKILQREALDLTLSTPAGRAKIAAQRSKAFKKWRAKNLDALSAKQAVWRDANRERIAESNREWRNANRVRVLAKNDRRRTALSSRFVEDVDRAGLWLRDDGLCGICGEWVDPSLPWPEKMSQTLDHIVPVRRLRPVQIGVRPDGSPLNVFVTAEGTTARGAFARQERAASAAAAREGRYRRTTSVRLMPEQIVMDAGGNRERLVELLTRYGYLY